VYFRAPPRAATDHILTCCEDTASQNVSVKSTLPAMPMRGQKIEEILCAVELAACYLGED